MLESESSECMAKKRPPRPRPAKYGEPFRPCAAKTGSPLLVVTLLVDLKTANTATTKPVLFQPPFSACNIGHIGLLVWLANFAMLESIKPVPQASTRASSRAGCERSAYHVAAQAMQDIDTAKPTSKSLYTGSGTSQASRPTRDNRWTVRIFLMTRDRSDGTPNMTGLTVAITTTSWPDRPICHSGKSVAFSQNPYPTYIQVLTPNHKGK